MRVPWRRPPREPDVDRALKAAHASDGLWSYPEQQVPLGSTTHTKRSKQRQGLTTSNLVIDGRCLQHPDFATRGIGRYTSAVMQRLATAGATLTIITDPALPAINPASVEPAWQLVSDGTEIDWRKVGAFIDPAPMTHPPSQSDQRFDGPRFAIVYDFIPAHSPDLYLRSVAERDDYQDRLERLRSFDGLWPISDAVATECDTYCPGQPTTVLPLPEPSHTADPPAPVGIESPFIFAALGADRRKNLPAAVLTFASLAATGFDGHLVILSHMPDPHRVELNVLATSVGLDHSRVLAVADLTDGEVSWLYQNASLVLMTSFDEGLSLPIIEALDQGCPVVASNISPHRELLGPDEPLCDPRSARSFADVARQVLADPNKTVERQQRALASRRNADTAAWLASIGLAESD